LLFPNFEHKERSGLFTSIRQSIHVFKQGSVFHHNDIGLEMDWSFRAKGFILSSDKQKRYPAI